MTATAGERDPAAIESYHAHVYFDAATRDQARRVRERVAALFPIEMGRWHERPVGPHPMWSYQVAFPPAVLPAILPWLILNREGLTVFLHPNTGEDLADHRDRAVWLGEQRKLELSIFQQA